MTRLIRQTHRWLGIVFTLTVAANFVAMAIVGQPPARTPSLRVAWEPRTSSGVITRAASLRMAARSVA